MLNEDELTYMMVNNDLDVNAKITQGRLGLILQLQLNN